MVGRAEAVGPAAMTSDLSLAMKLLIVDDHPGFRAFARAFLEAGGLDVVGEVTDGESALSAVHQLSPDVVLVDVMLPGMDGFAVCERLHAQSSDRPLLILTSSREEATYQSRIAASPAIGFIAKADLSAAAISALVKQ